MLESCRDRIDHYQASLEMTATGEAELRERMLLGYHN